MEYLIPIVALMLIVAGGVTYAVLNATKRSKPSSAESGEDSSPESMLASDDSPLGDTTEHSGAKDEEGQAVPGAGTGGSGSTVGGEGEGGGAVAGADDATADPDSDQVANR